MNVKTLLVSVVVAFIVGIISGFGIYSTFLCSDTNKAVVEQIKKDDKDLTKARIKTKVKYVYRDKIKTVIKTITSDECFDRPIPDNAANGLRDAFNTTR